MALLNAAQRKALPDSAFALITKNPDGTKNRQYPIQDREHASAALARVATDGTPAEQAQVHAAVKRRYPDADKGHQNMADRIFKSKKA